jgi:histidinol-phosphate aminotransferase
MERLKLNKKLDNIKPYEVDKRVFKIKLDANESFIPFPQEFYGELSDIIKAIDFNRYPDAEAEELCSLYGDYCGVSRKNVMAGNGSDELIQIITNALLGKGDKILTLKPDFSMYKFYASVIEGTVLEYSLDENLKFDLEDFIQTANREKVKIIIFSNPCNPTGGIIEREAIIKIIETCPEALVVVDEAYYEFYGETMVDCIDKYENLVVLRTTSKAMGLAGVRLGFLISNEELVYNIKKVKPPYNLNSLTQAVGVFLLKNRAASGENVERILKEREFLVEELNSLQSAVGRERFRVFPTKANLVYIRTPEAESIYKALAEMDILIRYFPNNALRITVGSREENIAVTNGLKKIF